MPSENHRTAIPGGDILLKTLRRWTDSTQETFADAIKMKRSTYGLKESGKGNVYMSELRSVARALGISLTQLEQIRMEAMENPHSVILPSLLKVRENLLRKET